MAIINRILSIVLLSLLLFAMPAFAQESGTEAEAAVEAETTQVNREAFYNSPDGFHVLIPLGWENRSSEDYAHFIAPEGDIEIYADSSATTDVATGIDEVVSRVEWGDVGEPILTSQIFLSNGEWTQQVYQTDALRLTAYGQFYEGATYVVVWISPADGAQPIVVQNEDVQAGLSDAAAALGYDVNAPVLTEEVELGTAVWTRSVYDRVSVIGRVRGDSTLALVQPGEANDSGLTVFYSLLTGFFLTPVTTPYLYLGVVATAVIAVIFILSLIVRTRSLHKDLETLQALS